MVGTMKRQWYRMTTAEVLRVISAEAPAGSHTTIHQTVHNRPLFLPKNSWHMYRYKVVRGGLVETIAITDINRGDIVVLNSGDIVPATLRLVKASSLAVQEDMIHGGAALSYKQTFASKSLLPVPEQKNMLFAGTRIIKGSAQAVVVASAQDTMMVPRVKSVAYRVLARKGITVQNPNTKVLVRKVDSIYFDDLQQPTEIIQLMQHIYIKKGIAVTFFVRASVARQLRHSLPETVFQATSDGLRILVDYSEERKAMAIQNSRQSNDTTMFVHRGVNVTYMPKIADINVVIAQHAQQIAIQQADLVMWRISIQKFTSILYNKK